MRGAGQDRADGALAGAVAQTGELALDAPLPQRGFCLASCPASARI
jgi:hypothetical protein